MPPLPTGSFAEGLAGTPSSKSCRDPGASTFDTYNDAESALVTTTGHTSRLQSVPLRHPIFGHTLQDVSACKPTRGIDIFCRSPGHGIGKERGDRDDGEPFDSARTFLHRVALDEERGTACTGFGGHGPPSSGIPLGASFTFLWWTVSLRA